MASTMLEKRDHPASDLTEGPSPVSLLVALSGGAQDSDLVRAAHRMAERDQLRWRAVHVQPARDDSARRLRVEKGFALATRLGGETRWLQGEGWAEALLDYAESQKVRTLIMGRSRPSGWRFWRHSLPDRLARREGSFDLVVMSGGGVRERWRPRARWQALRWQEPVIAIGTTLVALGVSWGLEAWLELANLSLLFLGAVLASATLAGTRAAMASAILGFLAFNFFFTRPRFSLVVGEQEQLLTVTFFLLVAIVVGKLAGSGRQRLVALRANREHTHRLLQYARALSIATDWGQVRRVGVSTLERWLAVPVVFLEADAPRAPLTIRESLPEGVTLDQAADDAVQQCRQTRQACGFDTGEQSELPWRFIPLHEHGRLLGVVGLKLAVLQPSPTTDQEALIDALIRQLAMALQRTRLVDELSASRLSEENERLRSALLSSVSHDLRTPLSSIIGSASALRDLDEQLGDDDKRELLDSILSESERLDRYIQNLLDMTRLGQGQLRIERDWISLDDLVGSALQRLAPSLEALSVARDWPGDLPLLHVHPALIEQALVNIIDNAARYSPPGGRIAIHGEHSADRDWLTLRITDQGPGIDPQQRDAVFDMFVTGGEGDRGRRGSGLGLAICRGMIGAHGGSVTALPGPDGQGTTIEVCLPLSAHEESPDAE
ncbi:ATP-binding protein [Halomonas sp. M4R1S46]|uniref:ATP-binding protein n=1 Tax=Halomonas sp. M4R1S46 TaxID=2982692 RepID=UPI0021E4EDBC|nr:ATP-binding protein [Halomonas sp. M4R1S46]UYG06111.1 DUF4118 domain-containing protein [Halomonas sp. M4R1S46]